MRIINYLATFYCGLLAVTKTLQYFETKPKSDFERFTMDVKKSINDDVNLEEKAIFLISILSVVLLVFWIVSLTKKSQLFSNVLLMITLILACFTYVVDNDLFF